MDIAEAIARVYGVEVRTKWGIGTVCRSLQYQFQLDCYRAQNQNRRYAHETARAVDFSVVL